MLKTYNWSVSPTDWTAQTQYKAFPSLQTAHRMEEDETIQ